MKSKHIAILLPSGILLIQLFLIVLFIILQVIINPRNHPQEFSVITGGETRISHLGDACYNIELNTFTPNIRTTVYLSRSSVVLTKNLEQIFMNNILNVGSNPNQLTYYGIPVEKSDEVNLNISSSNMSLDSLSVAVAVYEVEGFSQFLDYTSQNTDPSSLYNLDSCLLTTGCVLNLEAEFGGWLYVVFESTPTPSTLNVSLQATVREYDSDELVITSQCTLYERSPRCYLEVPTYVYYDDDGSNTVYVPFSLIYQTASLLTDTPPPSQALNVSVDLTWTCSRTDLKTYIVLIAVLSVTSIITLLVIIVVLWRTKSACDCSFTLPSMNCCKNKLPRHNHYQTARPDVLTRSDPPLSIEKESYYRTDSLPSYEKATMATTEQGDEAPYYEK